MLKESHQSSKKLRAKMQLVKATAGVLSACYGYNVISEEAEKRFPPEKPKDLAPLPGYTVFGYMGCPETSVKKIRARSRNLFFVRKSGDAMADFSVPQKFALWRTSNGDTPVVLQIEIREESEIKKEDLWEDPLLKQNCLTLVPRSMSLWPAIPPELQKSVDLQVRIHHAVTPQVLQKDGGLKRAFRYMFLKLTSS